MIWNVVKLSECCESIADGDHQAPPKSQNGIPFVTIANITGTNQFDFSNTMFVPNSYYEKLDGKRKAQPGDVLYSVVGSFGIPVLIKEDKQFVFQRHIAILRPNNNKVDSSFLYYTMLSRDFYAKANAVALGAAQRTVSLTALRNMEIALPALEEQTRIASILSAYDSLIKNNQKQIKLLEEAAQRLYKEWFVDLRFPGYENVKIVDGVPVSWKKTSIGELGEFLRGKTITKKQVVKGNIPVVAGGITPAYYHNKSNTESPVITVSASGNAGFVNVYTTKIWASDCSYLDINMSQYFYYILCSMKDRQTEVYTLQH